MTTTTNRAFKTDIGEIQKSVKQTRDHQKKSLCGVKEDLRPTVWRADINVVHVVFEESRSPSGHEEDMIKFVRWYIVLKIKSAKPEEGF